jgi:hypothetical protein
LNDADRLFDLAIEMGNAISDQHAGIRFGLHLCRGNNQSKFEAAGDYGSFMPGETLCSLLRSAACVERFSYSAVPPPDQSSRRSLAEFAPRFFNN